MRRHTGWVRHTSELVIDAPAARVGPALADLDTYPHWNELVAEAVRDDSTDDGPAWSTTLRARVGPFARAKQLRFVRTEDERSDGDFRARFERRELDGRDHAAWMMESTVAAEAETSRVTLTLSYEGGLWVPALGGVLSAAIERSSERLVQYVK